MIRYLLFRLFIPLFVTWHPATLKLRITRVKRVAIGSPMRCRVLSVMNVCDSESATIDGKSDYDRLEKMIGQTASVEKLTADGLNALITDCCSIEKQLL